MIYIHCIHVSEKVVLVCYRPPGVTFKARLGGNTHFKSPLLELSEAARQSHDIGLHSLISSVTHIPYPVVIQTKKLGHVGRMDTSIGRKANTLKHKAPHAAGQTRHWGST